MTAEEQRLIGAMTAQIESLGRQFTTSREELRADIGGIYSKLDIISASGCALGKRNMERIQKLEDRPEKFVSMGSAIIALLAAVKVFWPFGGR